MADEADFFWLKVKTIGKVTVAQITLGNLWKEEKVEALAAEIVHLIDDLGVAQLVLDLGEVAGLGSRMIGQLAALHRQVTAAGGRLVLCRLQPQAAEVIETCRLTEVFHVYPDEQTAVQSFT